MLVRGFSELVSPYRIHGNHIPFVTKKKMLVFCESHLQNKQQGLPIHYCLMTHQTFWGSMLTYVMDHDMNVQIILGYLQPVAIRVI